MLSESLRSFHDGVFVVTTPNGRERHENIRRELGQDGIEMVFSIERDSVSKEQLVHDGVYDEALAVRVDPKGRPMTLGHICCSIGHRRVYERILDTGCARALIFEDDVVALPVDEESIKEILANVPVDADIVQWGWTGGRHRPTFGQLQQAVFHIKYAFGKYKLNHRMIRNLYMRPYNKHFDVASVNFLAHAYTVTRSAAEKLIRWNTPINLNADHVLIHAILDEDVRGYVSLKQLFGQRSIDPNDSLESMTQKYY